jgi:hypothetical protein
LIRSGKVSTEDAYFDHVTAMRKFQTYPGRLNNSSQEIVGRHILVAANDTGLSIVVTTTSQARQLVVSFVP